MSWTDIELKWATMTSRIGADRALNDDQSLIARAPSQTLPNSSFVMRTPELPERTDA